MLNAIIKKLNGHGFDVNSLVAAIDQVSTQRQAAESRLAELKIRRHQALIDDAPDAAVDKIERDQERAAILVEKLKLAEPGLREQLAAAQAAKRKKAEPKLFDEYRVTFERYCELLREMGSVVQKASQIRARGIEELGVGRANIVLPLFEYGGSLAVGALIEDHVGMWITANTAEFSQTAKIINPPRAQARPSSTQVSPVPDIWDQKNPQYNHPTLQDIRKRQSNPATRQQSRVPRIAPMTAKPLPDDISALGPNEVRARVLRAGYPGIDGSASQVGRLVRVRKEHAMTAAGEGAIEVIFDSASLIPVGGDPNLAVNSQSDLT